MRKVELGKVLPQQVLKTNREQVQKIIDAARVDAVSPDSHFIYFAGFDGTNNDRDPEGPDRVNTNVAQLVQQVTDAKGTNRNIQVGYFAGVKQSVSPSAWEREDVTQQAIKIADQAYSDFVDNASNWLKNDKPAGTVTAVLTSFSRGAASAAIFSQMLYEKGVLDQSLPNTVLIPPGQVKVSAGILFDPVTTQVKCNLAFAPNVCNIVHIRAQDEYRQLFMATDYVQPCVKTVPMLGNHCDIGGGYGSDNGIAALTLEAATGFLKRLGLPIGDMESSRRFAGVGTIAIHSEDVDDEGHPLWDVYLPGPEIDSTVIKETSPRERDTSRRVEGAKEETSNGSTVETFILYNGKTITITRPTGAGAQKVVQNSEKSNRRGKRR